MKNFLDKISEINNNGKISKKINRDIDLTTDIFSSKDIAEILECSDRTIRNYCRRLIKNPENEKYIRYYGQWLATLKGVELIQAIQKPVGKPPA